MGTSYYYLVASLPMLTLGQPSPLAPDVFRARCREQLTSADDALLDDVLATGGAHSLHPFAVAWHDRETRLRNAVARIRAARLGREAAAYLRPERGFDTYTLKAVEEAFARPTPADRELDLDRFRWQVLDELAGRAPFSIEAVLAYALKLQLVARWAALEAEAGRRVVDSFVEGQAAAAPL